VLERGRLLRGARHPVEVRHHAEHRPARAVGGAIGGRHARHAALDLEAGVLERLRDQRDRLIFLEADLRIGIDRVADPPHPVGIGIDDRERFLLELVGGRALRLGRRRRHGRGGQRRDEIGPHHSPPTVFEALPTAVAGSAGG
jgi:hypothetical protein